MNTTLQLACLEFDRLLDQGADCRMSSGQMHDWAVDTAAFLADEFELDEEDGDRLRDYATRRTDRATA